MDIKMKNVVARNNGLEGIRIEGGVNLDAEDLVLEGNGGSGISILRHAPLLEHLGLPRETDTLALAKLLQELRSIPPAQREEHAAKSGLLHKIGSSAADMISLAANVASLADSPRVSKFIQLFSS